MTTRQQILRSSVPGAQPAAGTRSPGELWTTFPDLQLGVIDTSRNAQKLIAVRFFSTLANYVAGDFVIQAGKLYFAKAAVPAGAFNATQWNQIAALTDIPALYVLPTASTSVLGGVKIDGTSININGSGVISSAGLVAVSATPPSPVQNGALWFDLVGGQTYIWVDDGTSKQWVVAVNQSLGGVYLPMNGGTLTGPLGGTTAQFSGNLISGGVVVSTIGAVNSQASGSGNAAFGLYNNANAVVGFTYWNATDGAVYFQQASSGGWINVDGSGNVNSKNAICAGTGYSTKAGTGAAKGGNLFNINWASPNAQMWIDGTNFGNITLTSDYRTKQNTAPLPSMWARVKALKPIRYAHKDYTPPEAPTKEDGSAADPLIVGDNKERWGFVAHELQETLIEDAATGVKDQADCIQSPNPWTVIATLTKALQEAMTRIEALEVGLGEQSDGD